MLHAHRVRKHNIARHTGEEHQRVHKASVELIGGFFINRIAKGPGGHHSARRTQQAWPSGATHRLPHALCAPQRHRR
eukprot:2739869-Alexandrium_andersonii.AAC.1